MWDHPSKPKLIGCALKCMCFFLNRFEFVNLNDAAKKWNGAPLRGVWRQYIIRQLFYSCCAKFNNLFGVFFVLLSVTNVGKIF